MKALLLKEYGRLSYEDYPEPKAGPGEVVVRVAACGICGSDVHGMDGRTGRRIPPLIMGHEAAGVIAARGRGVTEWRVGERVTFDSTLFCGGCPSCRKGQINLCDRRRVLGVSCDEYRQHGAFAEYVAVPQSVLYRLPDDLNFARACLVEPLSVALHAVSLAPVALGSRAVVIGAGVIGLLVVQLLRAAGCGEIIAVDLDTRRLALALGLGAHQAVLPEAMEVRDMDLAFDAVGVASTVEGAIQAVRKGGHVILVGNLAPRVEVPLQVIVARQLTLSGSCASAGEYPICLDLMAREVVQVAPLISAVAPLAEGPEWFARLVAGEGGLLKVILTP